MLSTTQTIEKGYTASEKKEIKIIFAELKKASRNKDIIQYLKKVKDSLKA